MLMLAAEIWSFEVLIIMAGIIGEDDLAAFTASLNVIIFLYMIALGFQFASNACVGNNLGANRPNTAKVFIKISVAVAFILCFILGCFIYISRNYIASMITNDANLHPK